jgi:hypothetical protein
LFKLPQNSSNLDELVEVKAALFTRHNGFVRTEQDVNYTVDAHQKNSCSWAELVLASRRHHRMASGERDNFTPIMRGEIDESGKSYAGESLLDDAPVLITDMQPWDEFYAAAGVPKLPGTLPSYAYGRSDYLGRGNQQIPGRGPL